MQKIQLNYQQFRELVMAAKIRYTIKSSNRIRSTSVVGEASILSATLVTSDLTFDLTKKVRRSYGGTTETIILSDEDNQQISLSYIEESGEDDNSLAHVREWFKSVMGGELFELDLNDSGTYSPCKLISDSYREVRIGSTMEYSIPFKVRWI